MILALLIEALPEPAPPAPAASPSLASVRPTRPRPTAATPSLMARELRSRLPEYMQVLDADDDLLRFLSLTGDELGRIFDTLNVLLPTADWPSDLADPYAADPSWLPYMAQLNGVDISSLSSVDSQRAAIAGSASGLIAGTTAALLAAVKPKLTGSQWVNVARSVSGDPFRIAVQTYAKETPSSSAVLQAVTDAKAKPAGFQLDYQTLTGATYSVLETYYPVSYAQLASTFPTYDVMTAWTPV